jgi:uncharacterized C2H2 Zn-finger protein
LKNSFKKNTLKMSNHEDAAAAGNESFGIELDAVKRYASDNDNDSDVVAQGSQSPGAQMPAKTPRRGRGRGKKDIKNLMPPLVSETETLQEQQKESRGRKRKLPVQVNALEHATVTPIAGPAELPSVTKTENTSVAKKRRISGEHFPCPHCAKVFMYDSFMNRHIAKVHGLDDGNGKQQHTGKPTARTRERQLAAVSEVSVNFMHYFGNRMFPE